MSQENLKRIAQAIGVPVGELVPHGWLLEAVREAARIGGAEAATSAYRKAYDRYDRLTLKEVAEELRVSLSQLYKLRDANEIRVFYDGGPFVPWYEVERYKRESASPKPGPISNENVRRDARKRRSMIERRIEAKKRGRKGPDRNLS